MNRRQGLVFLGVCTALLLLEEFAFALHHVMWDSDWWRQPFLWSDRWHVLSFLAHWPLSVVVSVVIGVGLVAEFGVGLGVASWLLWQLAKVLGGKHWPQQWEQIGRWLG